MRKVALVTGSSRGIGAGIAIMLAQNGYDVCVNYIKREDKAIEVAERIKAAGANAICVQADVADMNAVKAMVERTEKELGKINVLVNNAGISEQHQFQDISPEFWNRIFAVNLGGCYNTIQCVLPNMLHEHDGCIVNVSSMWGQHGASCEVAYSSTKHAIIGLTRSLAAELAPTNIRVNCVCPGVIDTDMVKVLGEETLNDLAHNVIPMGRLGTPEEIAHTVRYFVENTYVTGAALEVDGGFII